MMKPKSSSVSQRANSALSNPGAVNNSKQITKKPSQPKASLPKPTIDRDIAKGLDTLDRQALKYLKESLKASRLIQLGAGDSEFKGEVVEEILEGEFEQICQQQIEESPARPKNPKKLLQPPSIATKKTTHPTPLPKPPAHSEIQEQIIEAEDDSPTQQTEEVKRVSYTQGKQKTHIKARPISAVQNKPRNPVEKNFSVDLYQQQYKKEAVNSSNHDEAKVDSTSRQTISKVTSLSSNPFKKKSNVNTGPKQTDKPAQPKEGLSTNFSDLLRRIQKLEPENRQQLEIILQKMEKGEIQSIQMSEDVIVMGRSLSKGNLLPPQIANNTSNKQESKGVLKIAEPPQPKTVPLRKDKGATKFIQNHTQPAEIQQRIATQEDDRLIVKNTKQHQSVTERKPQGPRLVLSPSKYLITPTVSVSQQAPTIPVKQTGIRNKILSKQQQFTLKLRIKSNWGHPSIVGLTEVELFDRDGQRIAMNQSNIVTPPSAKYLKLFNGKIFTQEQSEIWTTKLPQDDCVEIQLVPPRPVGAIRIWNYSKNLIEGIKGVHEMEIIQNGQLKWSGSIKKRDSTEIEDYSTLIQLGLNPGILIQKPKLPQPLKAPTKIAEGLSHKKSLKQKSQSQSNPHWLQTALVNQKMQQLKRHQQRSLADNRQIQQSKRSLYENSRNKKGLHEEDFSTYQRYEDEPKPIAQDFNQPKITNKAHYHSVASLNHPAPEPENRRRSVFSKNDSSKNQQQSRQDRHQQDYNSSNVPNLQERERILQQKAIEMQRDLQLSLSNVQKNMLKFQQSANDNSLSVKPIETKQETTQKRHQQSVEQVMPQQSTKNSKNIHSQSTSRMGQDFSQIDDKLFSHANKQLTTRVATKSQSKPALPTNKEPMNNNSFPIQKPIVPKAPVQNTQPILYEESDISKPRQPEVVPLPKQRELTTRRDNDFDNLINQLNDIMPQKSITMPTLPVGKVFKFHLISNWGDPNYIGLTGIEIFEQSGNLVQINPIMISSTADKNDTRSALSSLVNGVYLTTDECYQWLTPVKKTNSITIALPQSIRVAMIRIWNYNHSRIHSYRGVKYMRLELDGIGVFQGQIKKSNGEVGSQEKYCQYILFTKDEAILREISKADWLNRGKSKQRDQEKELKETFSNFFRPDTSSKIENQQKDSKQKILHLILTPLF